MRRGWFGESYRHFLARKGVSTAEEREVRQLQAWVAHEVAKRKALDRMPVEGRTRFVSSMLQKPRLRMDVLSGESVSYGELGGELPGPKKRKEHVKFVREVRRLSGVLRGARARTTSEKKKVVLQKKIDALQVAEQLDASYVVKGFVPSPRMLVEVAGRKSSSKRGLARIKVRRGTRFIKDTKGKSYDVYVEPVVEKEKDVVWAESGKNPYKEVR